MLDALKFKLEKMAFHAFSLLGDKLGIESRRIRMSFVYLTFVAIGSPVFAFALMLEFWHRVKRLNRGVRKMWDL